jgi:hypothetical protein
LNEENIKENIKEESIKEANRAATHIARVNFVFDQSAHLFIFWR